MWLARIETSSVLVSTRTNRAPTLPMILRRSFHLRRTSCWVIFKIRNPKKTRFAGHRLTQRVEQIRESESNLSRTADDSDGGYFLLTSLMNKESGYMENPLGQNFVRAGHAHAGGSDTRFFGGHAGYWIASVTGLKQFNPAGEAPEPQAENRRRTVATAGTTGCGPASHRAFDSPPRCRLR